MSKIDEDDEGGIIYVQYSFTLTLTRMIERFILPSVFEVSLDMHIHPESSMEERHHAMMRIKYWIENVASRSMAFSSDNKDALSIFLQDEGGFSVDNPIILTPAEPMDDLLAMLIQSKLNALADNAYLFDTIRLKSDNAVGMSYTFIGDADEDLPEIGEWLDGKSWYDVPWWRRNDATMIDTVVPEGADRTLGPDWAADFAFLNQAMPPVSTGAIIKTDFRPRIIEGGKKIDK